MPRIEWKKICCPVDFSEASRAAFQVAVDLARRFQAEITLLHVHPGSSATVLQPDTSVSADRQLEEWRKEAKQLGAEPMSAKSARGDPQVVIVDFVRDGAFDLVVMGTHGRTGRDLALLGSVTENVVRLSPCPVLTVHA